MGVPCSGAGVDVPCVHSRCWLGQRRRQNEAIVAARCRRRQVQVSVARLFEVQLTPDDRHMLFSACSLSRISSVAQWQCLCVSFGGPWVRASLEANNPPFFCCFFFSVTDQWTPRSVGAGLSPVGSMQMGQMWPRAAQQGLTPFSFSGFCKISQIDSNQFQILFKLLNFVLATV